MEFLIEKKRLGIMGGTFDPIHQGHLIAAEWVKNSLQLDEVLFIPTGKPAHKRSDEVTEGNSRFHMVQLAIESNPDFSVSNMEIERAGVTYTYDTILHLKETYGEETKLFFIIGADSLLDVHGWYKADELLEKVSFCAVTRPGFSDQAILKEKKRLEDEKGGTIHLVEIPLIEISSTLIRSRRREGLSVKYLVPDNVFSYIIEKGLYKDVY